MKNYSLPIISIFISILSLNSCKQSAKNQNQEEKIIEKKYSDSASVMVDTTKTNQELPTAKDRFYDDFARYIAGMPQRDQTSSFSTLENDSVWKNFSTKFDSSWSILDKSRLSLMRKWKNQEIAEFANEQPDVLYPFSGPDFLNAFTFFPKANNFTMIALESAGQMKDFNKEKPIHISNYLNSVDESLNDIFEKSYFITRKMLQHLQRDKVDGVLPLASIFMVRTGNKILDIKKINLDSAGTICEENWDLNKRSSSFKIYFVHPSEPEKIKTLTYFKADMLDANFRRNKALYNYLNNLPEVVSYLKSASYLLHYRDFSEIRNIVLKKSKLVLQDDTGIAYRFFKTSDWKFTLYGKYVKPVRDFDGVDQADLKKAYSDSVNVKVLPFSLGYHWGTKDQNLMIARKVNQK